MFLSLLLDLLFFGGCVLRDRDDEEAPEATRMPRWLKIVLWLVIIGLIVAAVYFS